VRDSPNCHHTRLFTLYPRRGFRRARMASSASKPYRTMWELATFMAHELGISTSRLAAIQDANLFKHPRVAI
jgi:hypothetical protein